MTRQLAMRFAVLGLLWTLQPLLAQEWTGRGRINGLVLNEADEPIPEAQVTLRWGQDPTAGPAPVTADKKGRWSYLGLANGSWLVITKATGYVTKEQEAAVNEFGKATMVETVLTVSPMSIVEEGNNLLETGNYAGAREKYKEALERLEPAQQAALRSHIGDTHFEEGNFAAARAQYEKALEGLPQEQQLHVLLRLGDSYVHAGDYAAARAQYERARSLLGPEDQARILTRVAQTYDLEGNRELAIEILQRAHSLDATSPEVLQLLTDLLMREGREDEAEAYLAELPADAKLPADLLLNLGIRQYNQGDLEGAFTYFDRAAAENPDLPEVYYYRGLVYVSRNEYERASSDFEKFLELAPEAPQAQEARDFLKYLQTQE